MDSNTAASRLFAAISVITLLLHAPNAAAQSPARRGAEPLNHPCGLIFTDHFGPFDYRRRGSAVKTVEEFHFTAAVETLRSGQSGYIGGDLNYTLRAVPNHHRALVALVRYVEREKSDQLRGMDFPVECYFDRAIRFMPDDTVVRALYAQFLHKRKRTDEGLRHLDYAVPHAGDSPLSHYNLGLIYLELGDPAKALVQAHRAQILGAPQTGLADQLKAMGKWQEPLPAADTDAAATAASAAKP